MKILVGWQQLVVRLFGNKRRGISFWLRIWSIGHLYIKAFDL